MKTTNNDKIFMSALDIFIEVYLPSFKKTTLEKEKSLLISHLGYVETFAFFAVLIVFLVMVIALGSEEYRFSILVAMFFALLSLKHNLLAGQYEKSIAEKKAKLLGSLYK